MSDMTPQEFAAWMEESGLSSNKKTMYMLSESERKWIKMAKDVTDWLILYLISCSMDGGPDMVALSAALRTVAQLKFYTPPNNLLGD